MADSPLERLRNPRFAHAVRGYDRHEVDHFLAELADWLERGADDASVAEVVRSALERVGEQTAGILTEAHAAAEAIRADAAAEARQTVIAANATAERLVGKARQYADQRQTEADDFARRTHAEAKRDSAKIVEGAAQLKRDIEAGIASLEQQREQVLAELDQIATGLTGATSTTRPRRAARPAPSRDRAPGRRL